MIGSATLNWENPDVRKAIQALLSLDPEGVTEDLRRNNVVIIEFATAAYRRLYG